MSAIHKILSMFSISLLSFGLVAVEGWLKNITKHAIHQILKKIGESQLTSGISCKQLNKRGGQSSTHAQNPSQYAPRQKLCRHIALSHLGFDSRP
jgi:hypothetical protein